MITLVHSHPLSTIRRAKPRRWLVVVLLLAAATGCVQRRLTVRSNPPGALVLVDNYEIGTTPCSVDFTYYGTRKIQLIKDGYETLTVLQPIATPWYEYPGIDFISENLVPGEIRDERTLAYNLSPQIIVPTEQLLSRAENLRSSNPATRALAPEAVVPPSPMQPFTPAPQLPPPPGSQLPPPQQPSPNRSIAPPNY